MAAEVELLREAARLMRERASGATQGRWEADAETVSVTGETRYVCDTFGLADKWPNAQHIASWDPAVALAVADLLDTLTEYDWSDERHSTALTLARRYLRLCTCTIDPDGARNFDGCVVHDFEPCGFLVDEVGQ